MTHFYLYFSNSGYGTGVLTSTNPYGPWVSPLKQSLVDAKTPGLGDCTVPFDPGVMIDDKGVGWLAFGAGRSRIARLGKDMLSFDSPFANPVPKHHFEANELNLIGGRYVYTYNADWDDHNDWTLKEENPRLSHTSSRSSSSLDSDMSGSAPQDSAIDTQSMAKSCPPRCCMVYMISTNPLDSTSWTYGNNYMNNPGECEGTGWQYANNHTHLHKFKGQWYLFYHNLMLQDSRGIEGGFRSMCVDRIDVDEATGHISFCKATNEGVEQIKTLDPFIRQEAETTAATEGISFKLGDDPGNMFVFAASPFVKNDVYTQSLILIRGVDFRHHAKSFIASLRGHGTLTVHLDSPDSPTVATVTSQSECFHEIKVQTSVRGTHDVYLRLTSGLVFDWWQFR